MEKLGIEPTLLVAQIVNFAIIVVVLSKLLYKPILDVLEKRKREIAQGLALTEKMRREEEKFKERKEKMLLEARKEGHEIIEEARKQAKVVEKDILDSAREEAGDVMEKGKAEVERLHEQLGKTLRREVSELAVDMAKRLLTKSLTNSDRHAIVVKHLKELESLPKE